VKVLLDLTDEQVDAIADRVADRIRKESASDVLTVGQAARRAQVSTETVRRWVRAGILPRLPGLRSIRIPARALEDYLKNGAGSPARNHRQEQA